MKHSFIFLVIVFVGWSFVLQAETTDGREGQDKLLNDLQKENTELKINQVELRALRDSLRMEKESKTILGRISSIADIGLSVGFTPRYPGEFDYYVKQDSTLDAHDCGYLEPIGLMSAVLLIKMHTVNRDAPDFLSSHTFPWKVEDFLPGVYYASKAVFHTTYLQISAPLTDLDQDFNANIFSKRCNLGLGLSCTPAGANEHISLSFLYYRLGKEKITDYARTHTMFPGGEGAKINPTDYPHTTHYHGCYVLGATLHF
jgi:hypothetical protein